MRPVHEETVHEKKISGADRVATTQLRPVLQMSVYQNEGLRIGYGVRCSGRRKPVPQERVAAEVSLGSTHAAGEARDVIAR